MKVVLSVALAAGLAAAVRGNMLTYYSYNKANASGWMIGPQGAEFIVQVNAGQVDKFSDSIGFNNIHYLEKGGKSITGSANVPIIEGTVMQCGAEDNDQNWCSPFPVDAMKNDQIFDFSKLPVDKAFQEVSGILTGGTGSGLMTKDSTYTASFKFIGVGDVVEGINNTINTDNYYYKETNGVCKVRLTCHYHPMTPEAVDKLFKTANITQHEESDIPDYTDVDNWGPIALVSFIMISSVGFVGVVSWMAITRCMDDTISVAGMTGITTRIL